MSRPHRIGIHVTLTDARGGTLIFWKGMDGAPDRNVLDALNGDAETEEVVIELYDADEYDSKISGCEPLTSVVLSGEEWRDLEGSGRLDAFFELLKGAGETIAAGEPFYLVAEVNLQTMELSHRRLVFTAAEVASASADPVEPGQARVSLPISTDRTGPLSQESALLGAHFVLLGSAGGEITADGPYGTSEEAHDSAQSSRGDGWSVVLVRNPLLDELEAAAQDVDTPQTRPAQAG